MKAISVPRSIRVVVADDHRIVRTALVHLLNATEGIEVVGEAGDGGEAVDLAEALAPDAVVLDYEMPTLDGLEATRQLAARCPGVRVIGLSMHDDVWMRNWMEQAGAAACVAKDAPLDALLDALRAAGSGSGNP